jgi:hypothetical protein
VSNGFSPLSGLTCPDDEQLEITNDFQLTPNAMIQIQSDNNSNIVYTISSGTLEKKDYDTLLPLVEQKIKEFGKIRLYFEMSNFTGWKPDAFLRDLNFDIKHVKDFDKIAMVGDKKWQEMITGLMKPFTPAAIRFFPLTEKERAKEWVEQ